MKKSERKLLSETLDRALAPPARRKPALASQLGEYDDELQPVPDQTQPRPKVDQTKTTPRPIPSTAVGSKPRVAIAPERDFNRRANSIEREALPQGLFPGASKRLYDALYLRTRGAMTPTRTIQATRRELMVWSGIKNIKTVNVHLRRLRAAGLLGHTKLMGEHEGSVYEVFLPEEANQDQTQTSPVPDPDRELVSDQNQKMVWVGSGNPTENKDTSADPKTLIKTKINTDDEASVLSDLNSIFSEAAEKLTGRRPKASEREQWAELARTLVEELNDAAARAESVSSVPAFLNAHLRRKLAPKPVARKREGNQKPDVGLPLALPPDPDRRLTPEEIAEQARVIAEVIEGGYTMEQAEAQFGGSFHAEDWELIRGATLVQVATEKGK